MKTVVTMVVLLAIVLSRPLMSHHSFSAEFDVNQPVKLAGAIAGVRWANPHAWVYVDVTDTGGQVVRWSVEMSAANQLYRRGWRKEDAPTGAQIAIAGYRARNGTPTASAETMTLSDGRQIYTGTAPERAAPQPAAAAP